jgi:hypothetical protein
MLMHRGPVVGLQAVASCLLPGVFAARYMPAPSLMHCFVMRARPQFDHKHKGCKGISWSVAAMT